MPSVRLATVAVALCVLGPTVLGLASAANWQPDAGDWAGYRRNAAHTGATGATSAFAPSAAELRIKWQHTSDPGYWVPPVAADLDGDGIAEVVAVVGNASADPENVQAPVSVESGLNVLNGATGALRWSLAPEAGYLDFYSPALGDIDDDGRGEIVFFHGQPLTGTSLTNKVLAYEADGTKKWEFSDTNWGSRVPLPLTAMNIGNVDGETAKQEVVFTLLLATVTTTISNGKVNIAGTNPEYRLIALNGEGSTATKAWSDKVFTAKATGSNVALGDLDEDGVLDMVYGVGAKAGTLIETSAARITVSNDFADDKIRGWYGGATPIEAFTFAATGFNPGELGTAPAIADLEGDGDLEIVQPLWVRNFPPGPSDTSTIFVLNADGSEQARATVNGAIAATIAQVPPALADLDGDGDLEIVVQTSQGSSGDRFRLIALRPDLSVLWRSTDKGVELTGVPAVGDITGDGKPEVLAMFGSNLSFSRTQTLIVFNGQTGAELFRKTFDVGATVGGPLLVDLDGDDDGRLEILVNTGAWGSPGKLIALEPELPDLRASNLAFSAAEHLHGVPETVSVQVTNDGSRTATDAVVRFTDGATTLHQETVTLAAGASTTVDFTWTPSALGARTIRAAADPDKAKPEWVETNNLQSRDVTVRAPELHFAAGDPQFSDANPGEGETIQVSVALRNDGGKDATNVLVRFFEDGTVFAERTIASLPKNSGQTLTEPLTISGRHDRTIAVAVDPEDAIVEENEANNRVARALDVVAPDLTVGAIEFSNANPGVGDTIQVSVPVRNLGLTAAEDVVVRFLDQGVPFGEQTIDLAEGASQTLVQDLLVEGEFDHTIEVVADPDDLLVEEDETNNAAARLLDVIFTAPDFALSAIAFNNPAPGEDDVVEVRVTVRNQGNRDAAGPVVVRFLDEGASFGEVSVPALAEGASQQVRRDLLVLGPFDHDIEVVVDPDALVNEQDEQNNRAAAVLRVLVPDLVLAASDIALSDPNPDQLDTLTVTATVRNTASGGKLPRDVLVTLLDEGVAVASDVIASVPAGGSGTAELAYVAGGLGPHDLTVQVDPLGAINELSDANNEAGAGIVVGKVQVSLAMSKGHFGFQEQASGVATLRFRNTGTPLAQHEFLIPVEYVARAAGDASMGEFVSALTALVARLGSQSEQTLHVCSMGVCVDAAVGGAGHLAQMLGNGGGAGPAGPEVRLRLFVIEARTNGVGQAGFVVPFSAFSAFDGFQASGALQVCVSGLPSPPPEVPAAIPACSAAPVSTPALPAAANVPGRYRATGVVDWFGFGFAGATEWNHV